MLSQLLLASLLYNFLIDSEYEGRGIVEAVVVEFWMRGFLWLVSSMYFGTEVDESVELMCAPMGAGEREEVFLAGGVAASPFFGLLADLYAISYNLLG